MTRYALAVVILLSACATGHPDGNTYREVWSADLAREWAKDGVAPQQDQDFFDCLVNETMASFTPAELGRLDVFVSTMNPDLQSEATAIVANRDKRIGGDLEKYAADKCASLAH